MKTNAIKYNSKLGPQKVYSKYISPPSAKKLIKRCELIA